MGETTEADRRTFGSVFAAQKGFGPGFDFVRIALAMSILGYHSVRVTGGYDAFMASPGWLTRSSLVPMFFAVSGFLITGSALRLNLRDFLINRGLRIIPALATEVILSAIIIGMLFSTLPLSDYVRSPVLYSYGLNIVGYIHYQLPGVFRDNPYPSIVNGSLWTIPFEYLCYLAMSLLIVLGLVRRRGIVLAITLLTFVAPVIWQYAVGERVRLPHLIYLFMYDRGAGAFQCFMVGILFYLYKDQIPFGAIIFGVCLAFIVVLAVVGNQAWAGNGWLTVVLCPPLTYLILYVGLLKIPRIPFYSSGDYSYGVYLYGYPLQQSIAALTPAHLQSWWLNFLFAAPLATAVAFGSWNLIEKPILRMRKKFSFVGRRIAEGEGGPQAGRLAVDTGVAPPPES